VVSFVVESAEQARRQAGKLADRQGRLAGMASMAKAYNWRLVLDLSGQTGMDSAFLSLRVFSCLAFVVCE
jgi:hypothetical protein